MGKAELDTKKQDLGFTRERLCELAQKFPQADAAVRAAAERVEQAKLALDLRPDDRGARERAELAGRVLDEAIIDRDQIEESVERLRRHETLLAFDVATLEKEMNR